MPTYTEEQKLKWKISVAKMLPDRIQSLKSGVIPYFCWNNYKGHEILETEWLQIVQWVEEKLTEIQRINYVSALWKNNPKSKIPQIQWNQNAFNDELWWTLTHATFEQRCAALEAAGLFEIKQ